MAAVSSYVEVAPAVPLSPTKAQRFTYQATGSALKPYTLVTIPFGSRRVRGVVLRSVPRPPYPTKPIAIIAPYRLTPAQGAFAAWLASFAHGSLGYTLRLFFPPSFKAPAGVMSPTPPPAPKLNADQAALAQRLSPTRPLIIHNADRGSRHRDIGALALAEAAGHGQALILVPEQWMVEPLRLVCEHLAPGHVAAYHSGLSLAQRHQRWLNVQSSRCTVVVGTQAALFLPYASLALVVVEEAQLPTHKLWDQYPRLHNIDGAAQLAALNRAAVVWAVTVPSAALYHASLTGTATTQARYPFTPRLRILAPSLAERVAHAPLPQAALTTIRGWLQAKQRVLVFCHRRGAWRLAVCTRCRQAWRCPNCAVALAIHTPTPTRRRLGVGGLCHSCGFNHPLPSRCVACGQGTYSLRGLGIQRVSALLEAAMARPVRLRRIDADTPRAGRPLRLPVGAPVLVVATSAAFTQLARESVDRILWLFPELMLFYPDYRSVEHAYLTLARLQSLLPVPRVIVAATQHPNLVRLTLNQTAEHVYERILKERRALGYPPYTAMVRLTVRATSDQRAKTRAREVRTALDARLKERPDEVSVLGPYQRFARKERGRVAYHLLLLGPLAALPALYQDLAVDTADLTPERVV